MEDIEKDTVNFIPTYDNERREPSILPGKFPNLLCNGGSGIAVGMATNMPPHNLREVVDAAMFLLDKPDATLEQLMQIIPRPGFSDFGDFAGFQRREIGVCNRARHYHDAGENRD